MKFLVPVALLLSLSAKAAVVDRYSDNLIGNWTWISGHLALFNTPLTGSATELPTLYRTTVDVDWDNSKGYVCGGMLRDGYVTSMVYEMDLKSMTWNRLTPYSVSLFVPANFGNRGVPLPIDQSQPTGRFQPAVWFSMELCIYLVGLTITKSFLMTYGHLIPHLPNGLGLTEITLETDP
jgi:hypothetical protein